MGKIRPLPPSLVNRIAAGECVERPASVVKELVENALDAGATRIDVEVEDGGRRLIRVADDGCGMDADDLAMSIVSHATSKISADDDLFDIRTMGFRGEALPSIASVSRLRIASRVCDAEVGHFLRVDAGEIDGPAPVGAPPGTVVEVRDLFFSVPARQKFLKTNQTEVGHISEQISRVALAHPHVAFFLRSNGRVLHRLEACEDRLTRIRDLFGAEIADALMPVLRDGGGVRVEGFVAPPAHCRKSNRWEYVFVNGRFIRDRFVSHAIKEAYRSLIQNEFPVAFLYVSLSPDEVDVNVHPTKIEVRWRDSNFIHGQVLAALREKFLTTNLDRPWQTPRREDDSRREEVRAAMVDFFTGRGAARVARHEESEQTRPAAPRIGADSAFPAIIDHDPPVHGVDAALREPASSPIATASESGYPSPVDRPVAAIAQRPDRMDPVRAVQVHRAYLIVETEDGVMIVDQHALHERILYEELCRRIAQRPLESQRLLLPDVVPVPPARLEALDAHADTLARLGVELAAAGPSSVALHAFPPLLERLDRVAFVKDLLDLLSEPGARPDTESLVHRVLDMMACKAAVKAGDLLTQDEITALLSRRDMAARSSHCPHGRPTTLHLSLRDLERQFKRR